MRILESRTCWNDLTSGYDGDGLKLSRTRGMTSPLGTTEARKGLANMTNDWSL